MPDFVFELGVEEMPARFFPKLTDELGEGFRSALVERKIDFEEVRTYATPRRLTVYVTGVAATQRSDEETFTGPPKRIAYDEEGNPTKAAEGFAKTQGVSLDDCFIQDSGKGEYLAVTRTTGGMPSAELLPGVCEEVTAGLSFPKKMRWGNRDFAFGRPVCNALALLDDILIECRPGGIESGRSFPGHRIMGPGPWTLSRAGDYFEVLQGKAKVVLDRDRRKSSIVENADVLAAELGGSVVWNESLLDEVCGLVEFPKAIIGKFDRSFLAMPKQVLLTSMESHQKSFGVQSADGSLLPYFVSTLNLEPKDVGVVTKGWERVLRARLEDARFFWETDLETELDELLGMLDNVVFIGSLGSMGDKSRRLEKLCERLADTLGGVSVQDAGRAGRLAKADLVSEMVGEFDELQGVMGGIYAGKKGENEVVADAVAQHYLPEGPSSPTPSDRAGAVVAIADKADTIAGCFGMNLVPTGANDPNALRRQALGISRIIVEHGLRLDLGELLHNALAGYDNPKWVNEPHAALDLMKTFFAGRLKAWFTSKDYDTLVVEAALGAGFDDVWALSARIDALQSFSKEADFEQAVLTFKRAANIIAKQGEEAGGKPTGDYNASELLEAQEKALAEKLEEIGPRWKDFYAADDFSALMAMLGELRPFVDDFFDNVMVMCDDPALRLNRLNLLKALVDRLSALADFGALQV